MATTEVQTAVAVIGKDVYKTVLTARTHTVVSDEPPEVGGTDQGPRPGDFLRMALASCTAITLRMYANRKGWAVDRIEVSVSNGPFAEGTSFQTEVRVSGQLTEEERAQLLLIARKCPVHKTLTHPIAISTELKMYP